MLIGRTQLDLGLDAAIDDYRRLIDNVAALGVTWLLDCGTSNEADFNAYFELMRRAATHAQDAGVQITMKPHGGISLTTEDLLHAYEEVHHPAFGICYDPGNIIYYTKGERRPETDIDKVAPRVSTGIIKDCVVEDDVPDVMVTPGEGLVDFNRVLKGLVRGGFTGPLYVECVSGKERKDIDRNVRSTLYFVKNILGGL
jgi:sugar phosphate isomerase/epimerase